MKCQVKSCGKEDVVFSGIDAFILNVPTEVVCYECANIYNHVSKLKDDYYERVKESNA